MNQTNLQKLETAIRTALPELMEFAKGCQAQRKSNGRMYVIRDIYGDDKDVNVSEPDNILYSSITIDIFNEYFDIIGHPITILHVLRWLEIVHFDRYRLDTDGALMDKQSIPVKSICFLNLEKPLLSQQSESVIDELVKLVG